LASAREYCQKIAAAHKLALAPPFGALVGRCATVGVEWTHPVAYVTVRWPFPALRLAYNPRALEVRERAQENAAKAVEEEKQKAKK
jgi:hypothetical protein